MGKKLSWQAMSQKQRAKVAKRNAEWRKKYPSLATPKFISGGIPGLGKKK
jgi:hypothetical protein